MIAQDPYLQQFVRTFTEINRGKAFFTGLKGLGQMIFEDYNKNRRKKTRIRTTNMDSPKIATLGELRKTDYKSESIQQELAGNLRQRLIKGLSTFDGLIGYENTVIPDIERALLSGHNINLLGLRGQAKTRIARQMTELLNEWIPIVDGSEINDCPLSPISQEAKELISKREQTQLNGYIAMIAFLKNLLHQMLLLPI